RHADAYRERLPGLLLAPLRPVFQRERGERREKERIARVACAGTEYRRRHDEAAIAHMNPAPERNALPWARQHPEDGQVPEKNLKQQRQIADELDISARKARDDAAGRQP